jgi:hypothetical protein
MKTQRQRHNVTLVHTWASVVCARCNHAVMSKYAEVRDDDLSVGLLLSLETVLYHSYAGSLFMPVQEMISMMWYGVAR